MLKQVIRQGVRCLDFEIYSINNKPVIAVSSEDDYNYKESFNNISFDDAMKIVNDYAFSSSNAPNPNDPILIHLRIQSKNETIYDKMADTITDKFGDKLLSNKYSYESDGTNIGLAPITKLQQKVIIIVDKSNTKYESTSLDELVNVASNSIFMRALRDHDVINTSDYHELIRFNKKHLTLTMPDLSSSVSNVTPSTHMKYGCQMVGMCYQNYDSNLEYYESFFAAKGSAFVLKPKPLRYTPTTIKKPAPQDPKLSYATRQNKSDYYDFDM
jgi:hypothetical protein